MPLARIITRTPQNAVAASDYLLSQGYTVETVSPGEFRITPAELELDLHRCGRGEAVDRARALVESHRGAPPAQTEVPAAPEPAQPRETKVPVAYDIAGRPVEFADEEEPQRRQKPNRVGSTLASMLGRVAAPVREFQRKGAAQRARRLEAKLARQREEIRREEELTRARVQQEMERQREEAELAERQQQEQIAAEQQAEQERVRVAALHEAMIAAERGAARQRQAQPVNWPEPAQDPPRQEIPTARPGRGVDRRMWPPVRRRRAPIVISGKAVVTLLGASLLLLLGFVAYANRRPASPLSPGALMRDGSMKQDVPFGAATITPAAAIVSKPSPSVPTKTSPAVRRANQKPRARQLTASPPRRTAKLKQGSEME